MQEDKFFDVFIHSFIPCICVLLLLATALHTTHRLFLLFFFHKMSILILFKVFGKIIYSVTVFPDAYRAHLFWFSSAGAEGAIRNHGCLCLDHSYLLFFLSSLSCNEFPGAVTRLPMLKHNDAHRLIISNRIVVPRSMEVGRESTGHNTIFSLSLFMWGKRERKNWMWKMKNHRIDRVGSVTSAKSIARSNENTRFPNARTLNSQDRRENNQAKNINLFINMTACIFYPPWHVFALCSTINCRINIFQHFLFIYIAL